MSGVPIPTAIDDDGQPRTLSLVNATRPPQGRKRVWRACNWCKIKKAKCDGSEPCKTCLNSSVECVFPEISAGVPMKSYSIDHIQSLENRLISMEAMFREFIEKQSPTKCNPNDTQLEAPKGDAQRDIQDPARVGHVDQRDAIENLSDSNGNFAIDNESMEPVSVSETMPGIDDAPGGRGNKCLHTRSNAQAILSRNDQKRGNPLHEGLSEVPGTKKRRKEVHVYTDEYGVLETDSTGELRYVGSQATISIVNVCDGLRSYIQHGLEEKGYEAKESYWGSPSETVDPSHRFQGRRDAWNLPPSRLVNALVQCFFERLYTVFPIIERDDFLSQYRQFISGASKDNDFVPVLFALLAVSASMLPLDSPVFDEPSCNNYRHANLGLYFYAMAKNALDYTHYTVVSLENLTFPLNTQPNSLNKVIALGLSSAYLAATGHEAEAWTTIGSVVRLGQDLGLHRSPEKLGLPQGDWKKRRCVWLCLYVMDRSLSISLGRQLAINDVDCDTIQPDCKCPEYNGELAGFFALVRLHQISGEIISMTSSVGNAKSCRQSGEALRQKVNDLGNALQQWAADSVPTQVKHAKSGRHFTERCVLLCAFFASIMLLHRPFMSNPHRESPLGSVETVRQCARAAINCIGSTSDCLKSIPPCHFLSLYGQQVFVSCVLLLHCLRVSKDELSVAEVLRQVQSGMGALKDLDRHWAGAKKCRGVVDEFLGFTLEVVQSGQRGRCLFHDEEAHKHRHRSACHSRPAAPNMQSALNKETRPISIPQIVNDSAYSMRQADRPEHNHLSSSSTTSGHESTIQSHPTPSTDLLQAYTPVFQDFRRDFNLLSPSILRRGREQHTNHVSDTPVGIDDFDGWFGASDLLNKDNFFSDEYLSPFLLTSALETPSDVWNVI